MDDTVFDSLLGPAFFDSYIKDSLEILKLYFTTTQIWGTSKVNAEKKKLFLACDFFTEIGFRNLIGAFVVNNLEMRLPATFTSSRHDQSTDTSDSSIRSSKNNERRVETSPAVLESALYVQFGKMNHSCVCNTSSHLHVMTDEEIRSDADRSLSTSIEVYAKRDIDAGEEITYSYLHVVDSLTLSRRARHRALRQYMFKCHCELCLEQKLKDMVGGGNGQLSELDLSNGDIGERVEDTSGDESESDY